MKLGAVVFCGSLLATGLIVLPAVHAGSGDTRLMAENAFTRSVKDGYQDLKNDVKEVFGGYTGKQAEDARNFTERRQQDLRKYHDAVRKAQKVYVQSREEDQKAYLKYHKVLPQKEDIKADMDLSKME